MPPATGINYSSWALVGFIFQVSVVTVFAMPRTFAHPLPPVLDPEKTFQSKLARSPRSMDEPETLTLGFNLCSGGARTTIY